MHFGINRVLLQAAAVLLCAATLTGCALRRPGEKTPDYKIEKLSEADLTDGAYYVRHGKDYMALYQDRASFEIENTHTATNESYVLWFQDDFAMIPTLYEGDSLILRTNTDLDRTFSFERYRYLGYTTGICSLKETMSGRYEFATDDERFFCRGSDAEKLMKYGKEIAVIDRIGNADLRAGNISEAGTILGLDKDKIYSADLYIGSKLQKGVQLKADTIALCGMDAQATADYNYERSDIIEIKIPENFNSGYYRIDNGGLFRYVKGSSYDKDTDFNIMNTPLDVYLAEKEEAEQAAKEETEGEEQDEADTETTVEGTDNAS